MRWPQSNRRHGCSPWGRSPRSDGSAGRALCWPFGLSILERRAEESLATLTVPSSSSLQTATSGDRSGEIRERLDHMASTAG